MHCSAMRHSHGPNPHPLPCCPAAGKGAIAYFPTYTLGAMYATQIFKVALPLAAF